MGRREDTGHGYTNVRMMAIVPILTTEGNVSHGKGITELPCQRLGKQKSLLTIIILLNQIFYYNHRLFPHQLNKKQ